MSHAINVCALDATKSTTPEAAASVSSVSLARHYLGTRVAYTTVQSQPLSLPFSTLIGRRYRRVDPLRECLGAEPHGRTDTEAITERRSARRACSISPSAWPTRLLCCCDPFAASRANCAALLWRSRAIGSKGERGSLGGSGPAFGRAGAIPGQQCFDLF
jgi:hypothetical protein